jgi:EmrB/QacA subfamily drug resistance transporter
MQTIFQVFPPEKRGSAMGIYGIGVVLAPALGPALGGIMVDSFSWRYVFFMAVPFCFVGLFLATLFMPGRVNSKSSRKFDWIGFGLMAVFLITLLGGLSNGQRDGWLSDSILIDFAVALISGIGFIVWELVTPAPLLNLKLFTNRVYAGASIVAFIFGAGIYGSTFLIPLFAQTVQGYTPTRSGLLLMPAGLVLALVFPIAGRLTDRTPAYATVIFGLVLFALSSLLMTGVDTNTSFWLFAWWIMLGRIGLGFIMPSLNAGALKALPMAQLGQGSGAINFVRQIGGAFGVNLLSIALERRSHLYVDSFTVAQHAGNSAMNGLLRDVTGLLAQAGVPEMIRPAGAMNYLGRVIYGQGNMLGYRDSFFIVGMMFLVALLPALIMRRKP